eukprot:TRINITY_DN5972_c0_g1_i1.p1 TRINITY_DN5972_c0_g1~~TRINITY_DN5972_c0_g1_i1.p1  ORF type:complete len:502 (-),score=178.67 TRINITY_DN5972_c0_g1_i1:529-2004(-)
MAEQRKEAEQDAFVGSCKSLIEVCKYRVMHDMIGGVNAGGKKWRVLVIDNRTMKVVNACCRMYDIIEDSITVVENIELARQPMPTIEAIYFVTPSPSIVDKIIADFKAQPQYAAVHIFFSAPLSKDEMQRLARSSVFPRIKTLKELNLDFLCYESNVCLLDMPESMVQLYTPDSAFASIVKRDTAQRIVSLCSVLEEYPRVRYHNDKKGLAKSIAVAVQEELDRRLQANPMKINQQTRATLVIADRTIDMLAPLLAEFTYQAMAYDVLAIQKDKYTYTFTNNQDAEEKKEVVLNDQDDLWVTLRHKHIADTITWVIENFNKFLETNKATTLANSKGKKIESLKEMNAAIRAMPQYLELLSKYALHMNMAHKCMDEFKARNLVTVANYEQTMACGEDAQGNDPKQLLSQLPALLSDPSVTPTDRLRIIMLFTISQQGLDEKDRATLFERAGLSAQQQALVSNLYYLGVTLNKVTDDIALFRRGRLRYEPVLT